MVFKPFEILRKMAVTIYRELRADSPTHYRFNIRISRSVISNVNKPAPSSSICHLARKCSTAGNGHHQDTLFVQLPGRLITAENKVQIFRVHSPRIAGNRKNSIASGNQGLGRRPPSGRLCRKTRAAIYVRGVRDPQSSPRADCRRHGAYRPALPGFGAVEEPED
jgi:hypothetical protein